MFGRSIRRAIAASLCLALLGVATTVWCEPIAVGTRLEPLVDDYLIESMNGVSLKLHAPQPKNAAIVFDAPWEGSTSCYVTVFRDDDRCRMYFRGSNYDLATQQGGGQRVCYAESQDGIAWTKPELGLFDFDGSKANNIVWDGVGAHNFAPFKDANPNCAPEAKYKALASDEARSNQLVAFQSPDAIHWSLVRDEPVVTEGAFDSQNLGFWDSVRNRYVEFHRGFNNGVRAIMTSTSEDFVAWTKPEWIDFGETPPEHLYTNAIAAYPRALHIFFGFPKRFVPDRDLHIHPYPGISDGVFMSSRDGLRWHRWREAFVRPGPQPSRWVNRNNMTAWGIIQTASDLPGAPDELSIYTTEGYYVGPCLLRRHVVRMDGFVSVNAPAAGGEFTTKPLAFEADPAAERITFTINYATSAAGTIRCEIQDAAGAPVPGYALDDCDAIYGDHFDRAVTWKGNADVKSLAERPVRLRFTMSDADLYALQFK